MAMSWPTLLQDEDELGVEEEEEEEEYIYVCMYVYYIHRQDGIHVSEEMAMEVR